MDSEYARDLKARRRRLGDGINDGIGNCRVLSGPARIRRLSHLATNAHVRIPHEWTVSSTAFLEDSLAPKMPALGLVSRLQGQHPNIPRNHREAPPRGLVADTFKALGDPTYFSDSKPPTSISVPRIALATDSNQFISSPSFSDYFNAVVSLRRGHCIGTHSNLFSIKLYRNRLPALVFRPDHCSTVPGHNECFGGYGGAEFYEASSWEYSFYVLHDKVSVVEVMAFDAVFFAALIWTTLRPVSMIWAMNQASSPRIFTTKLGSRRKM
ncbi:hypothetical protein B0H17DRAFT_1262161 [Mycena rosella]|uniref:Uncharacterized protein n=1 Tax=Mycena rosella TaxID=1033263 RepID=A0AAD7GJG5_MYCRO|nr:hypothetical protein B0H17DRAFT_1262161 [Mycena rosella]